MIEPPAAGHPGELHLFELLDAVEYAARHDDTIVVVRNGAVGIDSQAD